MDMSISKNTKKRLRRGAKSVEKSIKNLKPHHKKSGRKASLVAGTGVLVAAAAGAVVAVRLRRREPLNEATFHVNLKHLDEHPDSSLEEVRICLFLGPLVDLVAKEMDRPRLPTL